MRVWRLAREVYPVLDGEGARRFGGRWNSRGVPVVYTAGSRALAMLEYLAGVEAADVPLDLSLAEDEIPAGAEIEVVTADALPGDWHRPIHERCREIGDAWAASRRTLVLAVPSALVAEELNYLINPLHPLARRVRVARARRFAFDPRLLG
ncbi:MAG TPA: RES domain-containing protein [Longimicrobium sp.]|nr:RES domain-containing protein [Longimicrobium sp.]